MSADDFQEYEEEARLAEETARPFLERERARRLAGLKKKGDSTSDACISQAKVGEDASHVCKLNTDRGHMGDDLTLSELEPSELSAKTFETSHTPLAPTTGEIQHAEWKAHLSAGYAGMAAPNFDSSGSQFGSSWNSGSTVQHARSIFAEDNAAFLEEQSGKLNLKHEVSLRPDCLEGSKNSQVSTMVPSPHGFRSPRESLQSVQTLPACDRA